jgi:hypothetical protein
MSEQTPIEAPPIDPGNPLVRHDYPSLVTTGYLNTPSGMMLAITVRVANATVTLVLDRQHAIDFGSKIQSAAMNMPASGLIVPGLLPMGPSMPVPGQNGATT